MYFQTTYTNAYPHITDNSIVMYTCKHVISWTQLQSNYTWRKQKKGVANPQSYSSGFCGYGGPVVN